MMAGLVNFTRPAIILFERQRNQRQKQQLTTFFFRIKGGRNMTLNGGGKIRNITGAYGANRNEEIRKITK